MATLHKFKLFATQCAVSANSPVGSPSASPVLSIRRRRTLRTILARGGGSGRRRFSPTGQTVAARRPVTANPPEKDDDLVRRSLKDLFDFECCDVTVTPPPPTPSGGGSGVGAVTENMGNEDEKAGSAVPQSRYGPGSVRPAFGRRLLAKRVWRPLLSSIPE